jgi:hypothetical protein
MDTQRVHTIPCRRWTERAEYVEGMEEREQQKGVRWGKGKVEETITGIG